MIFIKVKCQNTDFFFFYIAISLHGNQLFPFLGLPRQHQLENITKNIRTEIWSDLILLEISFHKNAHLLLYFLRYPQGPLWWSSGGVHPIETHWNPPAEKMSILPEITHPCRKLLYIKISSIFKVLRDFDCSSLVLRKWQKCRTLPCLPPPTPPQNPS